MAVLRIDRLDAGAGLAGQTDVLPLVRERLPLLALPHFYQALELAPNDADVRTNLGLALTQQGKLEEALQQLNQSLQLHPNSAEAHNNLGLVLLAQGKAAESATHFSTALRLKPSLTVAQDNLKRAQARINTLPK